MDEFKTVARNLSWETKIERSVFIVNLKEISSEEEAKLFIDKISTDHKQATHNCYAYRLGVGQNEQFYYNDAGEPSGTAGKPIYGAILRSEITNVVIVVTRYFGGKKLGIRGLIDAYGGTALEAIEKAGIITKVISKTLSFQCSYPQLNQVNYLISKNKVQIINQEFGANVSFTVQVRERDLESFIGQISDYCLNINLGI
jgi:uncharacterized YigZ family protein